jgi:hypothetical protein
MKLKGWKMQSFRSIFVYMGAGREGVRQASGLVHQIFGIRIEKWKEICKILISKIKFIFKFDVFPGFSRETHYCRATHTNFVKWL